jgi:hypothetical protein
MGAARPVLRSAYVNQACVVSHALIFDTVWYAMPLVHNTQVVGTGLRFIFLALFTTAPSAGAALLVSRPCTKTTWR